MNVECGILQGNAYHGVPGTVVSINDDVRSISLEEILVLFQDIRIDSVERLRQILDTFFERAFVEIIDIVPELGTIDVPSKSVEPILAASDK